MLLEYIILHNIVLVYNNIVEVRSENIVTESIYFPGFLILKFLMLSFLKKSPSKNSHSSQILYLMVQAL